MAHQASGTETDAGEAPIEFRVRAWRRPVRLGLLLLDAALLGAPIAAVAYFALGLALAFAILAGAPSALGVVALILWKDNRPMPEGALRLLPGKLSYTGAPGAPVEIAVSDIRGLADDPLSRAILIRQKSGRRIAIPLARLDVPACELHQAIAAWVSTSGSKGSAAFAAEAIRADKGRNRMQTIMRWVVIVGVALGLLRLLVLSLGK
jgi:hypothetical protein